MHFAWLIILQFLYINASLGWKREQIVGGTSRIIEDFPFLASLRSNGHHTCAATIVNEQYLLTAAHCCRDINLHSVIVGATFRNDDGIDFDIDKVFIHEDYIDIYNGDDIAYIKIQGKFEYSDKIQPINLPLPDLKLNPTMMLEIVGWGKNEQKIKNFSVHRRAHLNQLQSAFLGYIYRGDCQKVYEDHDITITKKMICAGIPGKNVDTCQGDSGGPLVHEGMLIGIISWGFGCADPNFYGVYTNVRYYLDWINSHTKL